MNCCFRKPAVYLLAEDMSRATGPNFLSGSRAQSCRGIIFANSIISGKCYPVAPLSALVSQPTTNSAEPETRRRERQRAWPQKTSGIE